MVVRRALLDSTGVGLAMLGLVLALAAGIWYAQLDRTSAPAQVDVPRVVGGTERAAVRVLTRDGFRVRAVERAGHAKRGVVFRQRPRPGSPLAQGATVEIDVANGT